MSGEVRITMPLSYRPGERDDWGVIRDAEGQFLGKVSLPIEDSTLEDHRRTGTDPFQEIGRLVVDSVNSQVALGLPTLLPYPSDRPVVAGFHHGRCIAVANLPVSSQTAIFTDTIRRWMNTGYEIRIMTAAAAITAMQPASRKD